MRFIREVLGHELWEGQVRIAEDVRDHSLTVVQSCNSAGKDFLAGQLSLFYVYVHDALVLLTGPTARQVEEILMAEVARTFHRTPELVGKIYQRSLRIGRSEARGIIAFTSSEASRLTGFHAPLVVAIITEGQGVEPFCYEAMLACTTGEADRLLVLGNPLSPTGRFYHISRPNSEWRRVRISAFDTPNVIKDDPTIVPGMITRAFIERMRREYGASSSIYVSRVLGEFPESATDGLCQRSWLEAAADRFESGAFEDEARKEPYVVALDVARMGNLWSTYGPTPTHRRQVEIAREEFEALHTELAQLIETDLPALGAKLEAAGVPWTPGRGVPGK